jgi:hypothetical protein
MDDCESANETLKYGHAHRNMKIASRKVPSSDTVIENVADGLEYKNLNNFQ